MNKSELKKVRKDRLPWFYKLILKVPGTDFLESAGGVFWSIIVPVLLCLNWFISWLMLLCFPFPANIILIATIPTMVLVILVKVSLKRFLNWWDSIFGESRFEWDVDKTMREYLDLLKKKERRNTQ